MTIKSLNNVGFVKKPVKIIDYSKISCNFVPENQKNTVQSSLNLDYQLLTFWFSGI